MPSRARPVLAWAALFASACALRLFVILESPGVYAWDGFTRLWEREHLVVRDWLPIPQLPVVLLGDHQVALRVAFALVAAAGSVALGLGVARAYDRRHGLVAGWLAGTWGALLLWTVVPYQEGFLLLFVGLTLAAWPAGVPSPGERRAWWGAVALAAGALCRYEVWLLAVLLGAGALARRRFRGLVHLAPAAAVIVAWLATGSQRDGSMGPPREPGPGAITLFDRPADELVSHAWAALRQAGGLLADDLTWIVLLLAVWGLVCAVRRGGLLGRELAVFALALGALAITRAVNASVLTGRMLVPVGMIALAFAAVGANDLVDRASGKLGAGARAWLVAGPLAILCALYAAKGRAEVIGHIDAFAPERRAAEELAALPPDVNVAIVTRRMRNVLQESVVGAVFAHATGLDPRDARWAYPGKPADQPMAPPDRVLVWDRRARGYRLGPAPQRLRDEVARWRAP